MKRERRPTKDELAESIHKFHSLFDEVKLTRLVRKRLEEIRDEGLDKIYARWEV